MTIKRQWMLMLILTAIFSVVINTYILSSLINKYFVNYTSESYQKHFEQIVEYSQKTLAQKGYSKQQVAIQLEAHLNDPIVRIKLYNAEGQLIAEVSNTSNRTNGMMRNRAMNRMMNDMMGTAIEENDFADLTDSGVSLGKLIVTRYSSIGNSMATRMFMASLIGNSILSFLFVLILVIMIGALVSKKMSKDLMYTASLALNMDLGNQLEPRLSKVREIRIIQQSLETLKSRLMLKQTSRKKLVDELVHQTRTPLTILKTHLEGFQDGIISMTPEEIKICEAQIDNITSIVANMSSMIDAETDIDSIKIEEFELNQLIKQIISGLKVQFEKKQIGLNLLNHQKLILKTDKYKLSQSIYNILTNAYKFTGSSGEVSIAYKEAGDCISIAIEDNGSGISENDQIHLFDAYFRGSNSNSIFGEGIGLYVVKENLQKINGTISVESEPGKGSRFTICIPKII